jgi:hypothetical protein
VTATNFPGGKIDNKMGIEGHRYAGRKKSELMRKEEIDEEFTEIREEIENLALRM